MKQMKGMPVAQGGFTLVEIAIVLVIVGLLLGGVLQGQSLIENSRVRGVINDINGISAAITAYQDRYGRLPGDDGPVLAINGRGGDFQTLAAGNTDGIITGGAAVAAVLTAAPTGEPLNFWQHLRAAGLISGSALDNTITALPNNAFSGLTNVTSVLALGIPAGQPKLCFSNLPGSAARAIDQRLDDGIPNTGRVRAVAGALAAATPLTTYVDATTHSLCVRL